MLDELKVEEQEDGIEINRQGVPDAIWTNPTNQAKVYAGDIDAAR
jgi:hypothetical protein